MRELAERFARLCESAQRRSARLAAALEYVAFMRRVRELTAWMEETRATLVACLATRRETTSPRSASSTPSSSSSLDEARMQLDDLSRELGQRDDTFKELDDTCQRLAAFSQPPHPHKKEIVRHTNRVLSERESLFRLWQAKSRALDAKLECHAVRVEASALTTRLRQHQLVVATQHAELDARCMAAGGRQRRRRLPLGVDELAALLKSHALLAAKIERHVERAHELRSLVTQLVANENERTTTNDDEDDESGFADERGELELCVERLLALANEACEWRAKRDQQLSEAMRVAELRVHLNEFEAWIDEHIR